MAKLLQAGETRRHNRAEKIQPWNLARRQPTKPGFYWFRADDQHELSMIKVFVDSDDEWSVKTGPRHDDTNFLSNYVGEWAGPIPRPRNE